MDATRFNYDLGNSSIKKSADTLNNNYFKLTDGTDGCSVTVLAVMPNLGREKVPFSFGKRETTTFQMRTSSEWKMIYQILRQMAEKEEIGINYEFLYGQEEPGKTIGAKVFVRQGTASEGELRTWDYNRGSFPKVEVRINFSYSFSY